MYGLSVKHQPQTVGLTHELASTAMVCKRGQSVKRQPQRVELTQVMRYHRSYRQSIKTSRDGSIHDVGQRILGVERSNGLPTNRISLA